jgi:hypothetical protein
LRISGLREISSAVSAITIKIAFGEKMGATMLPLEHDRFPEAAEDPVGIDF